MAKMTLLEMTQDILSDMDSDEVNSIADTVEAMQVATVIKNTYRDIIASKDWPHLRGLITLTPSTTTDRPTHFLLPENIKYIYSMLYDNITAGETALNYKPVIWKDNEEFLALLRIRDSDATEVDTVSDIDDSRKLLIYNDRAPKYWTSFNDEYIVMDAYDNTVDTTLQSSKLMCIGYREPIWEMEDGFIPDIPSKMFPYLYAEAKSTCFVDIKQVPNEKSEQKARRNRARLYHDGYRQDGKMKFASYGRK